MNTYRTAEIAHRFGIHPNTVRLYEELGLIPRPERKANGYRVFTDFHVEQLKLARTALEVEVLQNGLRKQAIAIIKASSAGNFDKAIHLTERYGQQIKTEQTNAEEAIAIAEKLLSGENQERSNARLTRRETADLLQISIDALRNWEMNGLLTVKRKQNGYRVYSDQDIRRLKMIRALRCANYSLAAILRMLNALSRDPKADLRATIDTPEENDDVISVCDKLLTSLQVADTNARIILTQLEAMKKQFATNPPL
ncbi:MerR family transcriptional regulator [Paenibacillus senegalensis]|uniref:MerR family transcriptional regulator n=1 Tax=Paenibacillus senegalensis TaxID=1465766 RepID=UPI00028A2992|nr:MerR family transcriptional regulator [Paenibacillus senegalensis]